MIVCFLNELSWKSKFVNMAQAASYIMYSLIIIISSSEPLMLLKLNLEWGIFIQMTDKFLKPSIREVKFKLSTLTMVTIVHKSPLQHKHVT